MGRSLKNRVERLVGRMGDLTDPMVRGQAIVRAMSIEEIQAELRRLMLKGGFNPCLPLDKGLDAYIAKRESELDTLSDTDREYSRQYLALVKQGGTDRLRAMFPEYTRLTTEVHHV